MFAPVSTAVLAGTAPADQAKASGTNSTLRQVGVALRVAVLTAVFTGAGDGQDAEPAPALAG